MIYTFVFKELCFTLNGGVIVDILACGESQEIALVNAANAIKASEFIATDEKDAIIAGLHTVVAFPPTLAVFEN